MSGPETNDLPHSLATERNATPVIKTLRDVLPTSGVLLEIATENGQHAVRFALAFSRLIVTPADADFGRFAFIGARTEANGLPNLRYPLVFDVPALP